ncbi:MAG: hypothetical protein NUV40_00115 [Patescibacteria group bacterium]|nr:hypothetical protein [Patescibacteria group bacterium]
MNYYLGLSYLGMHDSNIALLDENGDIIFAVNEERFSRIKKDGRWPNRSLKYLKENFGVYKPKTICVPCEDPNLKIKEEEYNIDLLTKRSPKLPPGYGVYNKEWERKIIKVFPKTKIYYAGHHSSHAASAYFMSGFKEAIIVTIDNGAYNEPWIATVHTANREGMKPLFKFSKNLYYSPAKSYSLITALLGFAPNKDEGKITGLSSYGKFNQDCIVIVNKLIKNPELYNISFWLNSLESKVIPCCKVNSHILHKFNKKISKYSKEDVAFAIQYIVEKEVLNLIEYLKNKIKIKNIALAGGLFANIKINKKIHELGFDEIFVSPPMGDDGLAVGSVYYKLLQDKHIKPKKIDNVYNGYKISSPINLLKKFNIKYKLITNQQKLINIIANLLEEGNIIAIAKGKMELGPRSLGNRSILASPVNKNINKILSRKLKRTEFMPLAPAVMQEISDKCFFGLKGKMHTASFMTTTVDCKPYFKKKCPAVVHVDNTARPQLVKKEVNKFFHGLLNKFYKKTGCPSLMNTSFNMHGEPIVCTEQDALRNFFLAKLDYLVLGNCLIEYQVNQEPLAKAVEIFSRHLDKK